MHNITLCIPLPYSSVTRLSLLKYGKIKSEDFVKKSSFKNNIPNEALEKNKNVEHIELNENHNTRFTAMYLFICITINCPHFTRV